jgi:type VI secretion system protein ImpL
MTRPTKTWLIAAGIVVAYLVLAAILVALFHLHGRTMWLAIVLLTVLGLASAATMLWFYRDHLKAPAPDTPLAQIDATLAAARAQLSAAARVAKPNFGALPLIVVMGPEGSAKTTTVVRSGVEPELLAGDVFRGETVAATAGVNLWYAQNTLVVEAGGPVGNDESAWKHLAYSLRPRSLLSALTGRPQSPRLAIVCFGCDEFYKPGSGEAVPAAARTIRLRLGAAAKQFGVQLPTYVVFTKLDAVPHFDEFTRNFSADEAREPLGAAVDPDNSGAGTYADRVTPRLGAALDGLYASLAERRLQVLAREHGAEQKPGAYEFPREFRKLTPLATDFLREIGRPSELTVSPVLRGFYFSGVQAVFVNETTPEYPAPARQEAQAVARARSATAVFSAPVAAVGSVAAPAGAQPARKVPRWDFLPRLVREVVLNDEAAVRLTSAGARVSFWRRVGLASASVVAALLVVGFITSYSGNKRIESDALDATRGIAALPPNPVDIPAPDALRRLDALRAQVDTLSRYEHAGAPLGLRWGLYSGHRLYPEARAAYFAGFRKLIFANTRAAMLARLRALPDTATPADDYGATYALLKAYIITTSHPEKSTPEFLSPTLMTQWLGGHVIDSGRAQLVRRQFDTYATELQYENPFTDTAEVAAVATGRRFLRQFAGSERIYQFMLAEAAKKNPPIQFNRKVPGSVQYLVDGVEVPGAFTKGGSVFMLSGLKTLDKYLKGENWVVGDDAARIDQAKLAADLRVRYATDYIDHWRQFLRGASVVRYADVRDAAQKLAVLGGNQSPLLALLSTVSQNTAVDLPEVATAFQPVQSVTPATGGDKLVGPTNAPYMTALLTLQSSLDQTANAQGPAAEAAAGQATGNATAAKNAARQIAAGFTIDERGQLHTIVQTLMEAPISAAEGLLRNFGAAEINVRARAFCAAARPLLAKFPFNSSSTTQASLADVAAVLKPNTGSLWRFYSDALANSLPKQGTQYVPSPTSTVKFAPGFVTFINRAAAFSEIMFKDDSPEPHLSFTVQPIPTEALPTVMLSLDGEPIRSSASGNISQARIDWPGSAHEAKLTAGIGAAEVTLVGPYSGPWAVFQLFAVADEWRSVPNGYRVGWELTTRTQRAALAGGGGAKAVAQIEPPAAATVLRRGAFAGAECAGDIAK